MLKASYGVGEVVGWRSVRFAELCSHSAFGPRFSGDLYSPTGNVATLRTTDIHERNGINYETMPLAAIDREAFEHHFLQPGDLVITRSGRVGTTAVFRQHHIPVLPGAFLIRFRLKRDLADPRFYDYFFKSPKGQEQIAAVATGSVQQNVNITNLHQLWVPLPSIEEQKAVVGVLRALDDKIDLNLRMTQTLEAMAQALFRSWFVDFDPVRAKAAGRQAEGMDAEVASLFPSRFVDSDLGMIPEGWASEPLDRVAHFLNGLALQKFPPVGDHSLPVIKIAQLRRGSADEADRASAEVPPEYVVQDGDILFSWSGSLLVSMWAGGPGALNQHLFKVTSTRYPKWFCFHWCRHHLPEFQRIAEAKATTMGHIQRHHLTAARVAVPPTAVLDAASRLFEPLMRQWLLNLLEARSLAQMRDLLLPKLLSGEIRVRDAERQVAASA